MKKPLMRKPLMKKPLWQKNYPGAQAALDRRASGLLREIPLKEIPLKEIPLKEILLSERLLRRSLQATEKSTGHGNRNEGR
jgi:hypothetical protein